MFWPAMVVLILVAIFGLHVFTVVRWIFRLCILGLIGLFRSSDSLVDKWVQIELSAEE
jgi:hypothetical protein